MLIRTFFLILGLIALGLNQEVKETLSQKQEREELEICKERLTKIFHVKGFWYIVKVILS